jgi:hypothetical protein
MGVSPFCFSRIKRAELPSFGIHDLSFESQMNPKDQAKKSGLRFRLSLSNRDCCHQPLAEA